MRALVQRVTRARCTVAEEVTGEIGGGLVVLVGVTHGDDARDVGWLAAKIAGLRIFTDEAGRMNRDVRDVRGAVLVIPQFTLYGDARRGRRPDFLKAAPPQQAEGLVESLCSSLQQAGVPVERGRFRTHMSIELVNDGPVTIWLESPLPESQEPTP